MRIHHYFGMDIDLEISLLEYGFILGVNHHCGHGEYHIIYQQYESFGSAYIKESSVNAIVKGEEWADSHDIQGFLSFVGTDLGNWLELPIQHKISDLLGYWGFANIIGEDYYPLSLNEVQKYIQ